MSDTESDGPLDEPFEGEQPPPDPRDELPPPVFPPLDEPASPAPPPVPPAALGAYPEGSQATTALVLAVLHFVICPILGPIGWYMANQELTAIDAGRRDPANRTMATAARVVGIIGTVLLALGLAAGLLVLAAVVFSGMS